jgi:hypothetical protein
MHAIPYSADIFQGCKNFVSCAKTAKKEQLTEEEIVESLPRLLINNYSTTTQSPSLTL